MPKSQIIDPREVGKPGKLTIKKGSIRFSTMEKVMKEYFGGAPLRVVEKEKHSGGKDLAEMGGN
jgi:hypothetical protein